MLPFIANIRRVNGVFFKMPRNTSAMGSMPFTTRCDNLNTYLRPWNRRFASYLTGLDAQKEEVSEMWKRKGPFTLKTMAKYQADNQKITMVTAYDCQLARIAQDAGVDMVLVGDSLGNVVLGHASTTPVTMDDMVIHTAAVRRGLVPRTAPFLIGDMPFASYLTVEDALRNGARLVKEGGADAVKLEGGVRVTGMVRALSDAGVPVVGHVGLTPQTSVMQGGLGMQGKSALAGKQVLDDAKALQEAGAIAIVLECVPADLANLVTSELLVPTIGIGAGAGCSGQVLVMNDLLGFTATSGQLGTSGKKRASPFFVREFAQAGRVMEAGLMSYVAAVRDGSFPEPKHAKSMTAKELNDLRELLGKNTNGHSVHSTKSEIPEASPKVTRALVVGAGSMGCTLAAALDSAGVSVSIMTNWQQRRQALAGEGVTIEGVGGNLPRKLGGLETFPQTEELPEHARGSFDCVLVATKAPGVAQAAAIAASAASKDALIFGIQNGVGSLSAFDGLTATGQTVHSAMTTVGAKSVSAGRVAHTAIASAGDKPPSYFRLLGSSGKSQALCNALDSGFSTLAGGSGAVIVETLDSSAAIAQATWEKLAVNAVLNPICALYGVTNGCLSEGRFAELRRSLAEEVDAVAAAHGVTIPGGAEAAAMAVARSTAGNVCSTLADIRRGVETEIEFINGHIGKEAERFGLQAPVNQHIGAMVRALGRPTSMPVSSETMATTPVFDTVQDMRNFRRGLQGRVGFVPTMGGLHDGHLSLIQACRDRGCDHVIVSIFVNGSQFAPHEDFDKYPRDHSEDLKTLRERAPVEAVFAPLAREIYPRDPRGLNMRTRIEPLDIANEPEALARPHFFGGVATICASLFNIVQPDIVVFGQKDAVQCAVIQNLVEDLHMPIEVVIADVARTECGLAMSTRNKYLTPKLHEAAQVVPSALRLGAKVMQEGASLESVLSATRDAFDKEPLVKEVEYVTIADRRSGKTIDDLREQPSESEAVLSCAIKMEHETTQVRLIDNVCVRL